MRNKSVNPEVEPLTPEMESLFKQGMSLRNQGDHEGACKIFTEFIARRPKDFNGHLLKGSILLYNMRKIDEALECYLKAVELRPKSEIVSVGLFHCFWKKNLTDDAFEEMKRYVKVAGRSEEYARILDEMDESFGWRDKE